jgi:hypothetical protein
LCFFLQREHPYPNRLTFQFRQTSEYILWKFTFHVLIRFIYFRNCCRNFIDDLIPALVAQAQVVVSQLQSHVSNISQQVAAQAAALLQQLQQVAAFAHGQALTTIQGLIANLQELCTLTSLIISTLLAIAH